MTLTTAPSDNNGYAEAAWKTRKPGKKGNPPGTALGTYTATVNGVTAGGYEWDGVTQYTTFLIH